MFDYSYYNHSFGPVFGVIGMLFQLAWWFFVIWLFFSLFRHLKTERPAEKSADVLSALKLRYAKGEITKKEFDSIKKDIE